MQWTSAEIVPQVEPGKSDRFIVARRLNNGKWFVREAWYLNAMVFDNEDWWCEEESEDWCEEDVEEQPTATGWFDLIERGGAEVFEPLVGVMFWQPMPAPPEHCEHGVRDGDWCDSCNREYKLAAAEASHIHDHA